MADAKSPEAPGVPFAAVLEAAAAAGVVWHERTEQEAKGAPCPVCGGGGRDRLRVRHGVEGVVATCSGCGSGAEFWRRFTRAIGIRWTARRPSREASRAARVAPASRPPVGVAICEAPATALAIAAVRPRTLELAVGGGLASSLLEAIDHLPPTHADVVRMRDLEERPVAEVAQELHISRSNVAVRLHRAHKLLRRHLIRALGSRRETLDP